MASIFTNPRSSWPYIIMVSLLLIPCCIFSYLFTYPVTAQEAVGGGIDGSDVNMPLAITGLVLAVLGVAYTIFMAAQTISYRKQHPEVSSRALLFADSRDDDEMFSVLTGRASRVALGYVQVVTVMLIGLFMFRIIPSNPFWTVTLLSTLLITTMITYALAMRRVTAA